MVSQSLDTRCYKGVSGSHASSWQFTGSLVAVYWQIGSREGPVNVP